LTPGFGSPIYGERWPQEERVEITAKPRQNPDTTYQKMGDEAILINMNTGIYYSLNDTGTLFWELLDGVRSIADCARQIAADYHVEPEEVTDDLIELATEFHEEGLIIV
jgi:hypothetical protein